tara:strand:+ start:103 stop:462 length:360 start_codon:yes stop_codon:yes gene_type:complete
MKTDIKTSNRKREMVYARAVYYKLSRLHTMQSLEKIAGVLDRDHATALHGIKLFNDWIYQREPSYREMYKKIDKHIRKVNGTTDKDIDPAAYYKKKFAKTLLELRRARNENRLLKKQIV